MFYIQSVAKSLAVLCTKNYQNFMDHSVRLLRIFLIQNQIVNQVSIFFSAGTSWCAATCESVDCAGVSELFQQPVNATFRPSFV